MLDCLYVCAAVQIINRTTSDGILKMSEQRMDPQTGHTFYIQRNPQTGMEMKRGGEGHYIVEPQLHRVSLTEKGMEAVLDAMGERLLISYSSSFTNIQTYQVRDNPFKMACILEFQQRLGSG